MNRNLALLLAILAVIAALLIGVNYGKKLGNSPITIQPSPTQTPQTGQGKLLAHLDPICGVSLMYPDVMTKLESASGGAVFVNEDKEQQDAIAVVCQADIPRPPLIAAKIETVIITDDSGASIAAKLYHDGSAQDGSPIDKLIFAHPTNGMDIFVAGLGDTFNALIKTIKILR